MFLNPYGLTQIRQFSFESTPFNLYRQYWLQEQVLDSLESLTPQVNGAKLLLRLKRYTYYIMDSGKKPKDYNAPAK